MPLVLANRVQETGTANTTVSFTLTGAVPGFQAFNVIGNTNTTYYSATDTSGNWEVGLGTYSTTGPTLTRTTVYASSNSGSAVTFSGVVSVFVTYPSGRSVNLDGSGNVSALGTVSSGTWQGSTVGVAYGGTGVTTSSGPNSVVLRDANENITVNRLSQGLQTITASGGVTTLTAASDFNQLLTGTGNHAFRLPDATTLTDTTAFQFNNAATGTLTIQNNAGTAIGTVTTGGAANAVLISNATVGGTWEIHGYLPEGVTWGTNALALGSTVISGGTWQGGTIASGYGGTGLTTFAGANNALYSTSASALVAGTLPVAAGGTGQTTQQAAMNALAGTQTANRVLRSNGTNTTLSQVALATDVSGTLAVANGGTNLTTFGAANRALYSTGTTTLTAGTLPVLAGGTGTASPSLVAGTNVTISGSWPNQTVNASGGGSPAAPTAAGIVFGKTDGSVLITSLGYGAGCFAQGNCTVAIGAYAGSFTQGQKAIAIGFQAGDGLQGDQAIAIGYKAGYLSCAGQPTQSIVIAADAGAFGITATGPNQTHISPIRNVCSTSGLTSLFYNATTKEIVQAAGGGGASCATPYCVGVVYGRTQCGAGSGIPPTAAVSLGFGAGCGSSGTGSVAIGQYAAYCSQGTQAVAIGPWAACSCQGSYAVAIGNFAACSGQGSYAVAIGNFAGGFSQPANSIAIGNLTVPTGTNRTHIGPIRSASSPFYLYYCPCTREITYST